jgi:hypothetical protein
MAQQQAHLSSPDCEMKEEFKFDYRRGKEKGETEAKEWEIRVRELVVCVVVNQKR